MSLYLPKSFQRFLLFLNLESPAIRLVTPESGERDFLYITFPSIPGVLYDSIQFFETVFIYMLRKIHTIGRIDESGYVAAVCTQCVGYIDDGQIGVEVRLLRLDIVFKNNFPDLIPILCFYFFFLSQFFVGKNEVPANDVEAKQDILYKEQHNWNQ